MNKSNLFNSANRTDKINLLSSLSASEVIYYFSDIVDLTLDRNAEVRIAALHALRFIDVTLLTEVIKVSLRDENRDVRRAASELFHMSDIAA